MVRRPSGRRRVHPIEAHFRQIERIDKHVDHANRVAFVNEILRHSGSSVDCPRSASSMKRLINPLPRIIERIIASAMAFLHSQGHSQLGRIDHKSGQLRNARFITKSAKRHWLIRGDLLDGLAHGIHVFLQCGGPTRREPEADEAAGFGDPCGREFAGDPADRGGAHPHLRAVH